MPLAKAILVLAAVVCVMGNMPLAYSQNPPANATKAAPPPVRAPFDARQARAAQEAWASHLGLPLESTNTLQIKLVVIPPGEFLMGSTDEQVTQALQWSDPFRMNENTRNRIRETERPQHRACLGEARSPCKKNANFRLDGLFHFQNVVKLLSLNYMK